jgi:hypothetical protein
MGDKKLILNLDTDEYILTDNTNKKTTKPIATKRNVEDIVISPNDLKVIPKSKSTIHKNKQSRSPTLTSPMDMMMTDDFIIRKDDTSKNSLDNFSNHNNAMNTNINNNNVNTNTNINTDKNNINNINSELSNYENLLADITKKISKLQKRIVEPKYASKKSLYLSDLEKCQRRKKKIDKNIAICKNKLVKAGVKPNKLIQPQQQPQPQPQQQQSLPQIAIEPRPRSPRIEIEQNFNIPVTLPLLEDKTLPINTSIEDELSNLETELNLPNTIVPSNNNTTSTTDKKGEIISKNKQEQKNLPTQKIKPKHSIKERSPIAVSSQIKTIQEKEKFYMEQQKRIREKFKHEMEKIKRIKNQKKELERLKEVDKAKKKTYILEQKLKKLQRYKFLMKKITDIECAMTTNKGISGDKQILTKEKEVQQVFNKMKSDFNDTNIGNVGTKKYTHIAIKPVFDLNVGLKSVFAFINSLGFMPAGETITSIANNNKNNQDKQTIFSEQNNVEKHTIHSSSTDTVSSDTASLDIIKHLTTNNHKYTLHQYKPKYYSNKMNYINLDNTSNLDNIFNFNYDYNSSYCNNDDLSINSKTQHIKDYMETIINSSKGHCIIPEQKLLNEHLKTNNFNICKSYFNDYKNNLETEQFKNQSRYFNNIKIENVIDKVIHSNRNISKPINYKYKLVHTMNNIYKCMDKALNITFV